MATKNTFVLEIDANLKPIVDKFQKGELTLNQTIDKINNKFGKESAEQFKKTYENAKQQAKSSMMRIRDIEIKYTKDSGKKRLMEVKQHYSREKEMIRKHFQDAKSLYEKDSKEYISLKKKEARILKNLRKEKLEKEQAAGRKPGLIQRLKGGGIGQVMGGLPMIGGLIGGIGAAVTGLIAGIQKVAISIIDATNKAIEFETAMTGVMKTTGIEKGTQEAIKLEQTILRLSKELPVSATGLAEIGEIAGQLGLPREQIAGFMEEVAKGLTALTKFNGNAELLAETIAKLGNSFKQESKDMSDFAKRSMSVLNELANTTAANEYAISEAVKRMTSASAVGIKSFEAMAMAATGIAGGLEPEVVATGMNAMIRQIGKETDKIAKFLGTTREEFDKAFIQAPTETMIGLLEKINQIGDVAQKQRFIQKIFGDEATKMVLKLSGSVDDLRKNIQTGVTQYNIADSLQKEFNVAMDTTEKRMQLAQNRLDAEAIEMGKSFKKVIPFIMDLKAEIFGVVKTISNDIASFISLFQSKSMDFIDASNNISESFADIKIQEENLQSFEKLSNEFVKVQMKMQTMKQGTQEYNIAQAKEKDLLDQINTINPSVALTYETMKGSIDGLILTKNNHINATKEEIRLQNEWIQIQFSEAIFKYNEALTSNIEKLVETQAEYKNVQDKIMVLRQSLAGEKVDFSKYFNWSQIIELNMHGKEAVERFLKYYTEVAGKTQQTLNETKKGVVEQELVFNKLNKQMESAGLMSDKVSADMQIGFSSAKEEINNLKKEWAETPEALAIIEQKEQLILGKMKEVGQKSGESFKEGIKETMKPEEYVLDISTKLKPPERIEAIDINVEAQSEDETDILNLLDERSNKYDEIIEKARELGSQTSGNNEATRELSESEQETILLLEESSALYDNIREQILETVGGIEGWNKLTDQQKQAVYDTVKGYMEQRKQIIANTKTLQNQLKILQVQVQTLRSMGMEALAKVFEAGTKALETQIKGLENASANIDKTIKEFKVPSVKITPKSKVESDKDLVDSEKALSDTLHKYTKARLSDEEKLYGKDKLLDLDRKYKTLREKYKDNAGALNNIEKAYQIEREMIIKDANKKIADQEQKDAEDRRKKAEQDAKKRLDQEKKLGEELLNLDVQLAEAMGDAGAVEELKDRQLGQRMYSELEAVKDNFKAQQMVYEKYEKVREIKRQKEIRKERDERVKSVNAMNDYILDNSADTVAKEVENMNKALAEGYKLSENERLQIIQKSERRINEIRKEIERKHQQEIMGIRDEALIQSINKQSQSFSQYVNMMSGWLIEQKKLNIQVKNTTQDAYRNIGLTVKATEKAKAGLKEYIDMQKSRETGFGYEDAKKLNVSIGKAGKTFKYYFGGDWREKSELTMPTNTLEKLEEEGQLTSEQTQKIKDQIVAYNNLLAKSQELSLAYINVTDKNMEREKAFTKAWKTNFTMAQAALAGYEKEYDKFLGRWEEKDTKSKHDAEKRVIDYYSNMYAAGYLLEAEKVKNDKDAFDKAFADYEASLKIANEIRFLKEAEYNGFLINEQGKRIRFTTEHQNRLKELLGEITITPEEIVELEKLRRAKLFGYMLDANNKEIKITKEQLERLDKLEKKYAKKKKFDKDTEIATDNAEKKKAVDDAEKTISKIKTDFTNIKGVIESVTTSLGAWSEALKDGKISLEESLSIAASLSGVMEQLSKYKGLEALGAVGAGVGAGVAVIGAGIALEGLISGRADAEERRKKQLEDLRMLYDSLNKIAELRTKIKETGLELGRLTNYLDEVSKGRMGDIKAVGEQIERIVTNVIERWKTSEEFINSIYENRIDLLKNINDLIGESIDNLTLQYAIQKDKLNKSFEDLVNPKNLDMVRMLFGEEGIALIEGLEPPDFENFGQWIKDFGSDFISVFQMIDSFDYEQWGKEIAGAIEGTILRADELKNALFNIPEYLETWGNLESWRNIDEALSGNIEKTDIAIEQLKAQAAHTQDLIHQEYLWGFISAEESQARQQAVIDMTNELINVLKSMKSLTEQQEDVKNGWDAFNKTMEEMGMTAEEIEELFKSIVNYELNIFEIRKSLGLLGENEVELREKEVELLDKALQQYINRYGLQLDASNLTKDEIDQLLEASNYNSDIIELLMAKKNIQEEYNDLLGDELDFLAGIRNEEIDALKRRYRDVQLQLDLGIINEDQAMRMKKAIIEQMQAIMGGLEGVTGEQMYGSQLAIAKLLEQLGLLEPLSGTGVASEYGLPEYQEGTNYVPQTGMAMLHEGEAVIPPNANKERMDFLKKIAGETLKMGKYKDTLTMKAKALSTRNFSTITTDKSIRFEKIIVNANNGNEGRKAGEEFVNQLKTPRAIATIKNNQNRI